MKTLYRYRQERHFAKPPEALWPIIANTARINELAGAPAYQVEEQKDQQGRIRRFATARVGPIRVKWEESFGEWVENHRVVQTRKFINGPMRLFQASAELHREGDGTRLLSSSDIECVGVLGLLAKWSGVISREGNKRLAAIEQMIRESDMSDHIPGESETINGAVKPAARRRLEALTAELDRDPASHGLARKLAAFLLHAPTVTLRAIRPLTMARLWHASPQDAVELFLAAQRIGIVAMSWDLLSRHMKENAKQRS